MAKINLLPWREELRKQKKQDFLIAIGLSAGVGFIVIILVHLYIDGLTAYQEQRNRIIQDEIAYFDKKILAIKDIEEKKSKLLAKINLIQQLQESRPQVVHLFDEIPKNTPDGVFLTKFTQKENDLIFEGKSQSNARVSAFMRAIEASHWLHKPTLNVIKLPEKDNPEQLSDFTLSAKQGQNKPAAEKGGKHEPVRN
ncbi:MAG: PilN domain-containing protein [Chitinophagaceae bacterium]